MSLHSPTIVPQNNITATTRSPTSPTSATGSAASPSKTPISSLQEICQRMGKTPQYDLTAMEGRAHQPQFVYRCTVGDIMKTGQGGSKKAAKHAAAEAVLNSLKNGGDADEAEDESQNQQEVPEQKIEELSSQESTNPVGTLQELVVARGWRLPVYSMYAESGPAHKKEFIMCCTVESFKEYGSGTAKKHAKRAAATKMYDKIMALPADAKPPPDHEVKGKPVSFDILYNTNGDKIQPMHLDDSLEINVCQYLQQIAEHSNFSVEYYDIQEYTSNGTFQCMALLTTQPAFSVSGVGTSFDEAHGVAAKNAIRMLKIFFQRMSTNREGVKKEAGEK
ncbi:RISC-loading complex subunit tarbp2-like isoform X1 [Styela clava]